MLEEQQRGLQGDCNETVVGLGLGLGEPGMEPAAFGAGEFTSSARIGSESGRLFARCN